MLKKLKNGLFDSFNRMLVHNKTQLTLFKAINKSKQVIAPISNQEHAYFATKAFANQEQGLRDDLVFISSRFRSGSTVLWNVFRSQTRCTAYYEPFNERRWFNKSSQQGFVDSTHIGVDNYWNEYVGLDYLDQIYNEEWIRDYLHMDATTWDPQMKRYIEELAKNARGVPVLQFNRIDFRLAWIKAQFPNAKILHLYRHPRDQWYSFLSDKQLMNKNDVQASYKDAFYLDVWCSNLTKFFPFLSKEQSPHPYQRFYYLWKLSFLYGQHYSDFSFSYEALAQTPEKTLTQMFQSLNWENPDIPAAKSVLKPPVLDKWRSYADESWFEQHEASCERILEQFLGAKE